MIEATCFISAAKEEQQANWVKLNWKKKPVLGTKYNKTSQKIRHTKPKTLGKQYKKIPRARLRFGPFEEPKGGSVVRTKVPENVWAGSAVEVLRKGPREMIAHQMGLPPSKSWNHSTGGALRKGVEFKRERKYCFRR